MINNNNKNNKPTINRIKSRLLSMANKSFYDTSANTPGSPPKSTPMVRHLYYPPFIMGFHGPLFHSNLNSDFFPQEILPPIDSSCFTQHPSSPLSILLKHTNFYSPLDMECHCSPSVKPSCPFLGRAASPSITFLNFPGLSSLCVAIISSPLCLFH